MKYLIIIIMAVPVLYTGTAMANGFGMTLDRPAGDYIANVDYDAIGDIFAGEPVQFAFQLFSKDRSKQLDFTDVWVSMVPGAGATYAAPAFDGGIVGSTFPPSSMTFMFPKGGQYDLKLRYEKDGKTLAEASFPLSVENADKTLAVDSSGVHVSPDFIKGGSTVLVIVLGIELVAWMLPKRKKKI